MNRRTEWSRTIPASALADLDRGAKALGLTLNEQQLAQFEIYLDVLLLWRRRLSLTGAATAGVLVRQHILDSLPAARFVCDHCCVIDLGSGAGFPGVPLAIACPYASVTLVESRRKRASFLHEVIRCARLDNVGILENRAELIAKERPTAYDVVISRAVWETATFVRVGESLLKPGGAAIAVKGRKTVTYCTFPGFSAPEVLRYTLPDGIEHALVVYRRLKREA
jgi:16S rRNA (guanine527-N7)-methyltransferase